MSNQDGIGSHPFLKTAGPARPAQVAQRLTPCVSPSRGGDARPTANAPFAAAVTNLFTLAAIVLVPVAVWHVAWLLIEAMTRAPLFFVIVGAVMTFGGVLAWALCKAAASEPLRVEDDDIVVYSPMYGMRFRR